MAKNKMMVRCRCGEKFDLAKAPWCSCGHHPTIHTKECPKGHCVCHVLSELSKWRKATKEEQKFGFNSMLKEEHGGVKHGV